ncbi:hypothetical protein [Streptomyces uncialis]|uniref:hypothetical protein n=1 Tax=Streptomyces uncialis TaxID=1048205 RepID=UPI0033C66B61
MEASTADLEAVPFRQDGAEPLRAVRDVISAYRVESMAKGGFVHFKQQRLAAGLGSSWRS